MEQSVLYPAVFKNAQKGGFVITFPDFPEAISEGDDLKDAYKMAIDCLGTVLMNREIENIEFPQASLFNEIKLEKDEFLVVIEFDLLAYKKKVNSKAVKKTLSIPGWLNEEAMKKGINFSQILQEALILKLQSD